ncbi:hypothetical protein [Mesorhizobium sp.]|uniref:hypothetical protein n=1 Tax=Mesorhizobium sp. TaxID=1871066 RepID=UPI000FE97BB6|nr:hypothetical protein [Mesorhizobium sp.]RWB87434.1 MAG: hypothetical protein EOQ51_10570 [Mesorhizobium sp.]
MAITYKVETRQELTDEGVLGIWMLLISPIVNGLAWWFHQSDPGWLPLAVIAVSGMTFLLGFVLLIVGRGYDSTITQIGFN